MASGSSGRPTSASKGFDFASDDILCSYENYTNQDSSNETHLDPSIASNSAKVSLLSKFSISIHDLPLLISEVRSYIRYWLKLLIVLWESFFFVCVECSYRVLEKGFFFWILEQLIMLSEKWFSKLGCCDHLLTYSQIVNNGWCISIIRILLTNTLNWRLGI